MKKTLVERIITIDSVFVNKCLQRTEILMDLATDMNLAYRVIIQLRETQATKIDVLDISPAFYSSVFRTHKQSIFIDLAKVFDESDISNTESIHNLLIKMENNLSLLNDKSLTVFQIDQLRLGNGYNTSFNSTAEMISYYKQKIIGKETIRNKIKTLRDKHFAHIDLKKQNKLDNLFKENAVTLDDVEEMLVLFTNICMALYQYFKDERFIPIASNHEDFDKTIKKVEGYFVLAEKYMDYL